MKNRLTALIAASIMLVCGVPAHSAGFFDSIGKAFSSQETAQEEQSKRVAKLKRCSKSPIGTMTIAQTPNQVWRAHNLQSPEALVKFLVQKTNCFTIVDRGAGYDIAMRERGLLKENELQSGSEIGKGRIKMAQYILIPNIVSLNQNAGGNAAGAILGGVGDLIFPGIGAIAGSFRSVDRTASVTLEVTDAVTLEQYPVATGHAEKTDTGFAFGGAGLTTGAFAAAGLSSYANTEMGQIVSNAYFAALNDLLGQDKFKEWVDQVSPTTPAATTSPATPETQPADASAAAPQEETQ